MKKSQLFLASLASLSIGICFVSCKKNAANPKPDCKIVTLLSGSNATVFTYGADDKLSSRIAATVDNFTYTGNKINISNTIGTTVNSITTVILNANGLASSVSVSDAAGANLSNIAYTYNGTELSKSSFTGSSGGVPDITTYTYTGGNMVSSQNGSNMTTFEYDLDKPAQRGDFWNIQSLQQGYENIRTKNVLKSITSAANATAINYTFEADGKIGGLSAISGGSNILTISYQYECD